MKIAVVSDRSDTLEDIRRLFHGQERGAEVAYHRRRGDEALGEDTGVDLPDLLVLDRTGSAHPDMEAIEELTRRHANLTVLLLCNERSEEVLLGAMRAGVREVVAWPGAKREFLAAVERARRWAGAAGGARRHGRILAFVSCKGGSGATFLATNLGYALAYEMRRKVLLIDLDLQYGDASFFLTDKESAMSVADVAHQIERLDATFLASSAVELLPNYALLTAPEDAERALGVTAAQIDRLLDVATQNYDFVIVDLARSMDAIAMKALDRADTIYMVMEAMLPYVRDAKRMLRAFRQLGYPGDKVKIVVNRLEKDVDLPIKQVEKALNLEVHWKVPNDFGNASASVNQGVPIAKLVPASPVARTLRVIARDLAGVKESHRGWIGRLFRTA